MDRFLRVVGVLSLCLGGLFGFLWVLNYMDQVNTEQAAAQAANLGIGTIVSCRWEGHYCSLIIRGSDGLHRRADYITIEHNWDPWPEDLIGFENRGSRVFGYPVTRKEAR